MVEILVKDNDAGQRLDRFLQKTFASLPTSMMYKGIRNKKIKVNRKRCEPRQILCEGDVILLFLPPEVLNFRAKKKIQKAQPIDVVYENQDLLIVNKPYGLLSQSDQATGQDTLVERIRYYLWKKNEYDPENENSFSPAICNRLDRNTCGLVIAAKNAKALRILNAAIADHKIHKYYKALVQGAFSDSAKSYTFYIKKEQTKALVLDHPCTGYKKAQMDVSRIALEGDDTWVEVQLHTGRFHQIRAGMAHYGYPLVGDRKYGYAGKQSKYSLCAYKLEFEELGLDLDQHLFFTKN